MATIDQLLAGDYGASLRSLAEVWIRTREEMQKAYDRHPMSDYEYMIWEKATMLAFQEQVEREAAAEVSAGRNGAEVLSAVSSVITDEMEKDLEVHPIRAGQLRVMESLHRLTEMRLDPAQANADEVAGMVREAFQRAFKLDSQTIDALLRPYKGAEGKLTKNPKARAQAIAMVAIKEEWTKRKQAGEKFKATEFAKEMATKHRNIVTPEYLKNQQTKWNREYHPAS